MRFALEQPAWLWLVALALPSVILAWSWFHTMSPSRRATVVIARVGLLALLAAAIAGASSIRPVDEIGVVVVIDTSDSIGRLGPAAAGDSPGLRARTRAFLREGGRERRPDDAMGIVAFARSPVVVAPLGVGDPSDRELDLQASDATDIAAAIRAGAGMLAGRAGGGGRLILVSDGRETTGDALAAARDIAARNGFPIDTVPVRYAISPEVMVESLDAPATARERITLRIALRSTDEVRGSLRLRHGSDWLDLAPSGPGDGRRVDAPPGRHVEVMAVDLPPGRVHRFEAVFVPDADTDTLRANNSAEGVTLTPAGGSVLIVDGVGDGDPGGAGAILAGAIRDAGFEVDLVGSASAPADLLSLAAHDLIILQNIPGDALSRTHQANLAAYVRDLGGGLVMVGGPESFGAGGWKGSPLEEILPVRLDLPERLVRAGAATIIILDSSGSMGFRIMGSARTQQRIANEAAAVAIRSLDRTDLVGVISFNSIHRVVVPIGPNADPEATAQRVEAISSGGGTVLGSALDEAIRQLDGVDATVKHILVLSDGRADDTSELPARAKAIKDRGIRLSTIAIGDRADLDTMRELAAIADGAFYEVTNPNVLPRYFLKAVRIVRTPMVREEPFQPILTEPRSPLTLGIGIPPALGGLTLTTRREEPTVVNAIVTPADEPVLAHWNVELGQVAAFTSDAHRWAEAWLDWPGYRALWGQVARGIARPSGSGSSELDTAFDGADLRIRFRWADAQGRPVDGLSPSATIYTPAGEPAQISVAQVAPGEYAGAAPASDPGAYVVIVKGEAGGAPLSIVGAATRARGVEDRALRSDEELLRQISAATGGRVLDLDVPVNLFDRAGLTAGESRRSLWRLLTIWAIVALLVDIATRRIAWDRLIDREARREAARTIALAVEDRGTRASRTLAAIKRRPERPPASARVLGDGDAEALRREAIRRRAGARRAAAGQHGPGPPPQGEAPGDGAADLREAKRRARERFDDDAGQG